MVRMTTNYQGQLRCELVHGPSGTSIRTDAPIDNHGRGEAFSPTDLVGAALASCVLTTMAIMAERDGISLAGATASVTKVMNPSPRRIARLPVEVRMPASVPIEYRKKLEAAARSCPVHRSLHPDVEAPIEIVWL